MTFPDPARHARDAAQAIGATFEDLDQGGGYLFRISNHGRSVLVGAGAVASFPINSATAWTIARDKAFAKAVLAEAGIPVIPGGLFFAHTRRIKLRGPGREAADAHVFAAKLGWPVFCKPTTGARGNFAEIIPDDQALADYIRRLAVEFESFLIEPVIHGFEHRVLVHDGRGVFHAAKAPPALTGDGRQTIDQLLAAFNASLDGSGVSPWLITATGRAPAEIPRAGERILLAGRRNLGAEGEIAHFSTDIPPALLSLAKRAVSAIGLRIGAVDLFDRSAAGDLSDLVVIEVNGNPGLKTLELAGRADLVRDIWTSMLSELLGSP